MFKSPSPLTSSLRFGRAAGVVIVSGPVDHCGTQPNAAAALRTYDRDRRLLSKLRCNAATEGCNVCKRSRANGTASRNVLCGGDRAGTAEMACRARASTGSMSFACVPGLPAAVERRIPSRGVSPPPPPTTSGPLTSSSRTTHRRHPRR